MCGSASFIPVTSCISVIHLLLGHPLLLLPSPHASIIPFSNPSDRITCPKNPSFLLNAVCYSVSFSSISTSNRTLSLVIFSIHNILCIFFHIHISHALICFCFCHFESGPLQQHARRRAFWTDSSRCSMLQRGSSATGGSMTTSRLSSVMFC